MQGYASASLSVFLALISINTARAQSWICVEDMATGFILNEGKTQWKSTDFKTTVKFLIKPIKNTFDMPDYIIPYEVRSFEDFPLIYLCKTGFYFSDNPNNIDHPSAEFFKTDNLDCSGMGEFRFNIRSFRYLRSYLVGFTWLNPDGSEVPGDTPLIAAGRCLPLEGGPWEKYQSPPD